MSGELSEFDQMRLVVRGAANLEDASAFMKDRYKVAELEALAAEAGVESPAKTKDALIEQIIAKVTSGEEANVDADASETTVGAGPDASADPDAESPEAGTSSGDSADEASSDAGVLPEEGRIPGVSLPEKVAKYRPEQLWSIISGWEVDQGLGADARAAYTNDELREYIAYLWYQNQMSRPRQDWLRITEYEFQGIRDAV